MTLHEGLQGITSIEEAALFAAACAERASGILFWVVSEDGRHDDLDQYHEALELLWAPVTADSLRYAVAAHVLEGLREMRVGDELIGPDAHALHAVVVLHSALRLVAEGSVSAVTQCSVAAQNAAFRIEARTGHHLLSAEERCQARDIGRLLADESVDTIRDNARRHGRDRLALVYAHYR
ncbi:hypothetical protein [Micromonospora sp. NPDC003776]